MFSDIRDWPYLSLWICLCDWLYSASCFVGLLYNDTTDKYIYIYTHTHTHTHTKVTWFQASATILMRSALFWYVTRRSVVIQYRRFGTTHQPHLQGPRNPRRTRTSWPSKMGPTGCFETSVRKTTLRCVTYQKSADLIFDSSQSCKTEWKRTALLFTFSQQLRICRFGNFAKTVVWAM